MFVPFESCSVMYVMLSNLLEPATRTLPIIALFNGRKGTLGTRTFVLLSAVNWFVAIFKNVI